MLLSQMTSDDVDKREVKVFVGITIKYVLKYTDKLLPLRKVYCEIVIAKWSRHVTKLAINRQEITRVSLFGCIYVRTACFYTC